VAKVDCKDVNRKHKGIKCLMICLILQIVIEMLLRRPFYLKKGFRRKDLLLLQFMILKWIANLFFRIILF